MLRPSRLSLKNKRFGYHPAINVFIFIVFLFSVVYFYLKDTSLFVETILAKEQDDYQLYFREDFEEYEDFSEILDDAPENLSRWQNGGVVTAFANISDWTSIRRIDFELTDVQGKSVILPGIENISAPRENNGIKIDDEFPDFEFKCDQPIKKWEDFMLVNGQNFLFWEYSEKIDVNMSEIVAWKAVVDDGSAVTLSEIVIHDGLCAEKNSLNGKWKSPNGLPQYGVWWPQNGSLIMRNIEQEQYPSNGDHVRILSDVDTPDNFILKVEFTVNDPNPPAFYKKILKFLDDSGSRKTNTYIRIGWDFDDEYDPGHDQSFLYASYEYGYVGLQRVYPIERYFIQGYEPERPDAEPLSRDEYTLKNGHSYELEIKVDGQNVRAELFERGRFYSEKVASVNHEFQIPRPPIDYPISIESTGNIQLTVDKVEIWEKIRQTSAAKNSAATKALYEKLIKR